MQSTIMSLLTGSVTCLIIGIVCNSLTSPCFATPVDANRVALERTKLENSQTTSKPLIINKEQTVSSLSSSISNDVETVGGVSPLTANQTKNHLPKKSELIAGSNKDESEFPDRRGFFTGHRIPLELFGDETLRHIELIGEVKNTESEALPRVPPGHPRRIPLELFSEDTLSRVDGIDEVVEIVNFPRRIPLELFPDESLKRIGLLNSKEEENEDGPKSIISGNVRKSYVNSDAIRGSSENSDQNKRIPKAFHGGINDDPEAAAHHFSALSIGGEGDPAFLDTLLSIYR